jgi:hypothetical protein
MMRVLDARNQFTQGFGLPVVQLHGQSRRLLLHFESIQDFIDGDAGFSACLVKKLTSTTAVIDSKGLLISETGVPGCDSNQV